MIGTLKKNT